MPDVTLTEARFEKIASHHDGCGAVCEAGVLVAALRASRERLRSLANTWESQADDYPAEAVAQYAAVAVRLCARELRAALGDEAPHE